MPPESEYVTREEFQRIQGALQGTRDAMLAFADANREPSKARLIGQGPRAATAGDGGAFLSALANARNADATAQAAGKAELDALGIAWAERLDGKATLGETGPHGGYVMPNNVVDDLVTIATASNLYRNLLTVVPNVATAGVDIPVEDAAPTRATVVAWGALKPNVDLALNRYTATLYTMARIMDLSNQLIRHSAGAAQADVVGRLGRAFALGEAYYTLQGSGTNEPYGLLTALAAVGGFDTNKGAATTTVATSIAGTLIAAIEALALRAVKPDAIVLDPVSYFKSMIEATTTFSVLGSMAGVAMAPMSLGADGIPRIATIPFYADPNMPANTGIAGEFKALKMYLGMGYRVDVSDQAGVRWDYDLTGIRAEEEFGLNALPAVIAGRFQRLTNLNT
jgi:HK97 family phage major capsid protein